MSTAEIHLFIIWEYARSVQDKILNDIAMHFTILKQYEITWSPKLVPLNFTRFCGTRLGDNLQFKIDNCGIGEFLVVIVRDENPIYENRKTFHGFADVNVKMFEAKQRYRKWTGGGVKVHATDSLIETNHDLSLLIGKNVEDFLKTNSTLEVEKLHKDLEGAEGWNSIEQLFYVLNNTVRYAVMRGYGELTTGDFIDHGDTDIMTDDYDNLWLIVNAPKKYANTLKPKANVQIGDKSYLLDIWNCGTNGYNYFDPIWARKMLDTAIELNGIKILDPENDFYCLLYHCLTNKGYITDDYLKKLQRYKQEFGLTETDWNKILVAFLQTNQYEIIRPTDTENPFRLSNPDIAEYALHNGGVCILSNESISIYEFEQKLIVKNRSDIGMVNRDELINVLNTIKPIVSRRPKSLKSRIKALLPKRIQKIVSNIWKHMKRK